MNQVLSANGFIQSENQVGTNLNDFKILNVIGKGSYGAVYKAISLFNNNEFAIKKIEIN